MDYFAEPVIGRRFAPARWLVTTLIGSSPPIAWQVDRPMLVGVARSC
jgi:hypothetical protein